MEPRADGTFVQHDIGPGDGIVQVPGRWTQKGNGLIAVEFDGRREDYAFSVVSVETDLLRIRMASAAPQYPTMPTADAAQLDRFAAAPPATGFRLIDFDAAEIVTL